MNKAKLDSYLRNNGGLNSKQITQFFMWTFFNFKKCQYFYVLCEEGLSNFVAFNKACRDSNATIRSYLKKNIYS